MDAGQDEPRSEEAPRAVGEVYPPSEDTFFLADHLKTIPPVGVALEVGVGSGYLTSILASKADFVVGTDISQAAVAASRARLHAAANVDILLADTAAPFRGSAFDLVVSNPPYLPCEYEEEPLWCGGPRGVEFTVKLAEQGGSVLKSGGRLLLLASSLADLPTLLESLKKIYARVEVVKAAPLSLFEKLFIVECWHTRSEHAAP